MFCNFLLQLNMAKCWHAFFNAFCPETEEKINWWKTKFALTCSFQKVTRTLSFSGHEKLAIHFISKFLVWFDSQLYKL